ncbi:MAG: CBS domain-containing protein [Candidatus Altiarchaeota archaeon]|nr:CBS domain-containing protein [Candidatus Altiarchaeota archaeon]
MATVKDIMTRDLVHVEPGDLATKARSIIRKHGYRALPVLEKGRLAGIVSRGDILRVTANKTNITVKGLMTKNLTTVSEGTDLCTAAKKIIKSGAKQLLVADEGELRGIVSSVDILKGFIKNEDAPVKEKIADIMKESACTCTPEDEIAGILDMMHADGLSGLPVVKNKKVIGVVTRMNVIKKGANISKESGKTRKTSVGKIMTTPAAAVNPETKVREAAQLMVQKSIVLLPVVDNKGSLLGTVDIEDVLQAYLP